MKFEQMEKKFNENEDEQGNGAAILISSQNISVTLVALSKRDRKVDDLTMVAFGFASANDLFAA